MIVGNLVQGNRLAAAYGRDIGGLEEDDGGGGRRYQVREIEKKKEETESSDQFRW